MKHGNNYPNIRDGNTFHIVTGNFERDMENPRLSHNDLHLMIKYLEELTHAKMFIADIEADINTVGEEDEQ